LRVYRSCRPGRSFLVVVDNTPPEIFFHFGLEKIGVQKLEGKKEDLSVYPTGTFLYLPATDQIVGTKGIYYSLNNQPETPYERPIKLLGKGVYELKIKAVDYLGNQIYSQPIEFVLQ